MKEFITAIDKALEPIFRGLPNLPKGGREGLVKAFPVIAIVLGILQLFALYGLLQLAFWANRLADYANSYYVNYGYNSVAPAEHVGVFFWVAMVAIALDALILLFAFAPLRKRLMSGWRLLFLGALINLVYGVVSAFTGYGTAIGSLIGALIGSAIGFYLLYQIKPYYNEKSGARTSAGTPSDKAKPTSTK